MKVAVCASACFHAENNRDKTLLKAAGLDVRRMSAQSRFAVAGILPFRERRLPPETAVFFGTDFGSRNVFDTMRRNMRQGFAKPLDFLAHLHNAPVFHVCAALGLSGVSVVEAADNRPHNWLKPLFQAMLHLNACGGYALAGWCLETPDADGTGAGGGSLWLLLSAEETGAAELELQQAEAFAMPSADRLHVLSDGEGNNFLQQATGLFSALQAGQVWQLPPPLPDTVWRLRVHSLLPFAVPSAPQI
ncbi:MAG: hypothetical protein Q4A49_03140 [Neisseria sp.]|nr:hypothetical protein [Neisseria sp.]